jgi:hypothetical protein
MLVTVIPWRQGIPSQLSRVQESRSLQMGWMLVLVQVRRHGQGLFQEGLAQEGLAQEGLFQEGLAQEGLAQEGLAQEVLAKGRILRSYKYSLERRSACERHYMEG